MTHHDHSHYTIEARFNYQINLHEFDAADGDAINIILALTTTELRKLEAKDIAFVIDQPAKSFWISVLFQPSPDTDPLDYGWSLIRSAFHAANIATPGFPTAAEASLYATVQSANIERKPALVAT